MLSRICTALLMFACAGIAHAQPSAVPQNGHPRVKADLLLFVAHPDDDVLAGSYLAKVVLDQGKKVAVRLGPGEDFAFESRVLIPKDAQTKTETLTYSADGLGSVSVKVVVQLSGAGLPQ